MSLNGYHISRKISVHIPGLVEETLIGIIPPSNFYIFHSKNNLWTSAQKLCFFVSEIKTVLLWTFHWSLKSISTLVPLHVKGCLLYRHCDCIATRAWNNACISPHHFLSSTPSEARSLSSVLALEGFELDRLSAGGISTLHISMLEMWVIINRIIKCCHITMHVFGHCDGCLG